MRGQNQKKSRILRRGEIACARTEPLQEGAGQAEATAPLGGLPEMREIGQSGVVDTGSPPVYNTKQVMRMS